MGRRRSFHDESGNSLSPERGGSVSKRSPPPSTRHGTSSPNGSSKVKDSSSCHSLHRVDGGIQEDDFLPPLGDWTSRTYGGIGDPSSLLPSRCERFVAFLLLAIVAACGAAVAIVGMLERWHPLVRMCPSCSDVDIVIITTGASTMFITLIGVVAVKKRIYRLSFVFVSIIFLVGLVLLGLFVMVLVFRLSPSLSGFEAMWTSAVRHDPQLICTAQQSLDCSGYRLGCCSTNSSSLLNESWTWEVTTYEAASICYVTLANGSFAAPVGAVVSLVDWPTSQCAALCVQSNRQTTLCGPVIQSKVDASAVYVLVALFFLACVMCSAAVLTLRNSRSPPAEPERVFLFAVSDD